MVVLGHGDDVAAMHELAEAVCEYHRFGIPLIAEMLPADPKLSPSPRAIADLSRIGAEVGADVIKTCMTEDFASVVGGCPVPIIIAGGSREKDFVSTVRKALLGGAKGVAMGRNLYQHEDPPALIRDVVGAMGRPRP
jgi:DhnA family fructose-bisphosphate aldolase class Ia